MILTFLPPLTPALMTESICCCSMSVGGTLFRLLLVLLLHKNYCQVCDYRGFCQVSNNLRRQFMILTHDNYRLILNWKKAEGTQPVLYGAQP